MAYRAKDYHNIVDIISMTTHSPEAQVEVQDEIAKLKTKIEVLEAKIEEYENEYKQATGEERKGILLKAITAKEGRAEHYLAQLGRLHDLSDELKALRQQGNAQRTCPFILWFFHFQSIRLLSYVHIC
jgi:DNA repair exonuclease SbcCD ATPase subunit